MKESFFNFQQKWNTRVKQSEDFKNLAPVALLLCELVHMKDGDLYIGHPYVLRVQEELHSRGLIPIKISNYCDMRTMVNDIDRLDGMERTLIDYVSLSFQREYGHEIPIP